MPDDAPSFAVAAAKDEGGGSLRVALEPLSSLDEGACSLEPPFACKWLCLRREYLCPYGGGEPPLASALFAPSPAFPILLSHVDAKLLFRAARAFEAERAAKKYLFRAEHSRFQLELKLAKKGFSAKEAAPALDFLEKEKALDDRRFALAWLNTRSSLHPEGRLALCAALSKRGVCREDADAAIKAFFDTHDEEELCRLAAEKLMRRGRFGEKLISSLLSRGFPIGMALRVTEET